MKKYLFLLISAIVCISMLAVFSLAGCKAEEAVTEEAPAEEVEAEEAEPAEEAAEVDTNASLDLNIIHYSSGENWVNLVDDTIAKFNEKWPNVNVVQEIVDYQDYGTPLKLSFSSGQGYDMVYVDFNYLKLISKYGKLMDITDEINKRGWADNQLPGALDQSYDLDGILRTVPMVMVPCVVYYNKDIFSELNLEVPKTLPELETISAIINDAGYVVWEVCGQNNVNLLFWGWGLMYSQDRISSKDMNDWYLLKGTSQAWKDAFIFAFTLINDWVKAGYLREGFEGTNYFNLPTLYSQGDVAMVVDGDWNMPAYEDSGVPTGAFALPNNDDPEQPIRIVNSSNGGWGLNANLSSEEKAAALDLIGTFLEPDIVRMWYEGGTTPTVTFDATGADVTPLKAELNAATENTELGCYQDTALPGLVDIYAQTSQLMTSGQITPEEFWDEVNEYYEKIKAEELASRTGDTE